MRAGTGIYGETGARVESLFLRPQVLILADCLYRSADMVTQRLDRLIQQIRTIQQPHMDGSKPADVVLVSVDTTLLATN